jgi:hypothetical protein
MFFPLPYGQKRPFRAKPARNGRRRQKLFWFRFHYTPGRAKFNSITRRDGQKEDSQKSKGPKFRERTKNLSQNRKNEADSCLKKIAQY